MRWPAFAFVDVGKKRGALLEVSLGLAPFADHWNYRRNGGDNSAKEGGQRAGSVCKQTRVPHQLALERVTGTNPCLLLRFAGLADGHSTTGRRRVYVVAGNSFDYQDWSARVPTGRMVYAEWAIPLFSGGRFVRPRRGYL